MMFFTKQHVLIKILFVLFSLLKIVYADINSILIFFVVSALYFLIQVEIIKKWLFAIIKIIPIFISLFLLGIFFKISFIEQLLLISRILTILLFSIYLTVTIDIDSFLADTHFFPKMIFFQNTRIFIIALFSFIPVFLEKYKTVSQLEKKPKKIVKETLLQSLNEIKIIEYQSLEKLKSISKRKVYLIPNLSFIPIILVYNFTSFFFE